MPFPMFVFVNMGLAAATVGASALLSRWRWLAVAAALLGATALLLVQGLAYFDYYADDAYITLRYSRHLADGLGPNWNAEGRVEGYTTFLWMSTLAGLAKLGFDLVDTSRALGFLALVGTLVSLTAIWKLWGEEERGSGIESPVLLATALIGLTLIDGVTFWGFSGMETPLFMALITAGAYLHMRERRQGAPWSAMAFAAAAMTRPEGLIAAAVTGAFVLAELAPAEGRPRAVTRALAWGSAFVLLYGSYFIWRYAYYDYLFPNTYYAKVGLNLATLDRGLGYLQTSGLQYHLLPLLAGVALLLARERVRRDAAYVLALTGALLAGLVVEGASDPHGRFFVPVLPLLMLAGLAGLTTALRRLALHPAHAAALAGGVLALGGLALLPLFRDPVLPLHRRAIDQRAALGEWLNENTPPDYVIGDFMIGAIAYHANDRAFLDLLGLNDVVIAHTEIPDMGAGVAGHEKFNVDYVLNVARPQIIVLGQVHPAPVPETELRELVLASSLFSASNAYLNDPRLWQGYQVRAVNLGGHWHHFLQRIDTLEELRAPGLR